MPEALASLRGLHIQGAGTRAMNSRKLVVVEDGAELRHRQPALLGAHPHRQLVAEVAGQAGAHALHAQVIAQAGRHLDVVVVHRRDEVEPGLPHQPGDGVDGVLERRAHALHVEAVDALARPGIVGVILGGQQRHVGAALLALLDEAVAFEDAGQHQDVERTLGFHEPSGISKCRVNGTAEGRTAMAKCRPAATLVASAGRSPRLPAPPGAAGSGFRLGRASPTLCLHFNLRRPSPFRPSMRRPSMLTRSAALTLVALLAACGGPGTPAPGADASVGTPDGGAEVPEYSLRVGAKLTRPPARWWTRTTRPTPRGRSPSRTQPRSRYSASRQEGGSSASATLEIQRAGHALTILADTAATSVSGVPASGTGKVGVTGVCAAARGAKAFKVTWACEVSTFQNQRARRRARRAASAGKTKCSKYYLVDVDGTVIEEDWNPQSSEVTVEAVDGEACWLEDTDVTVNSTGGTDGGSAAVKAKVTLTAEPVY
jgi:hypothetical protein